MFIESRINELFKGLVQIRRDFHKYPELGMEEYRTSRKICEYLDQWNIDYEKDVGGTGIVGIIQGTYEGKTIAIRADMDAIPQSEMNDVSYKSLNSGIMHACGHDAHMTILLGTGKILSELKEHLKGTVKLFFQPAEETVGGALPMIKDGCMENPHVDYVIGLHVEPDVETGKVRIKYNQLNASSDDIHITIKGVSGHGAYPHTTIDALMISGYVVTALQSIVSRNISPNNGLVITLGTINGGKKYNNIADEVVMTGTLRALTEETRRFAKERIKSIVENTANAHGGIGEVTFKEGYAPLINNDYVVDHIKNTCEKLLGKEAVLYKQHPSLGVEDFSYFARETKGGFYHLGCGNEELGITSALHHASFNIDEKCLKIGVLLQVHTALDLLEVSLDNPVA